MNVLALVVGLTVAVSFLCSLVEAALYSVPVSHIEMLERKGRPAGRLLAEFRGHIDRPIAAILSLNTIANTGGAAIAGALAATVFGGAWVLVFSAGFTVSLLLVGEVVPKTVGVAHARRVSELMARPLQVLVVALTPLIWVTRGVTSFVLRAPTKPRVSDEDVLVLVRLGLRSGAFKSHEATVIENVLGLESKTARHVLTPRSVVFALPATASVADALAHGEIRGYSRVPVYDQAPDDLIGVVQRTDILMAQADGRSDVIMEELMRPIDFIADGTPLDQLLRLFLERRDHLVAVVDEFGGIEGIVTLEDVVEELLGREIVGEHDRIVDLRAWARRRREAAGQGIPARLADNQEDAPGGA